MDGPPWVEGQDGTQYPEGAIAGKEVGQKGQSARTAAMKARGGRVNEKQEFLLKAIVRE